MKVSRLLLILLILVVLLAVVGYVGASYVVYQQLSRTVHGCGVVGDRDNTPAAFDIEDIDTTPYLMPDYEDVTFTSRGDGIQLAGWFVPAGENDNGRAVILIHGLTSCKGSTAILLPAGMLHRAGYSVLMLDMRDHGSSQVEDGRYAGGSEEWRDVLGGWDWLTGERGFAPERVGLFGTSLGAVSVMVAAGEEPQAAAVWADSGFASIQDAVNAELTRNGFPTILSTGALAIGRLISGDDIAAYSPAAAMSKLNGRPIYITHGTADTRLSVVYAAQLSEAVSAAGGTVEPWIVEGAEHVEAMFNDPAQYEERLLGFFNAALGGAA